MCLVASLLDVKVELNETPSCNIHYVMHLLKGEGGRRGGGLGLGLG